MTKTSSSLFLKQQFKAVSKGSSVEMYIIFNLFCFKSSLSSAECPIFIFTSILGNFSLKEDNTGRNFENNRDSKIPTFIIPFIDFKSCPMALALSVSCKIYHDLGVQYGVPTPIIDSMITLAGAMHQKDFLETSRYNLEYLGIDNMSKDELLLYLNKGEYRK